MPDFFINLSHFFTQPDLVHAAHLIQQNSRVFALKDDFRSTAQGLTGAGDGRDDDAGQYGVHVVWRHHQRRACFLNFTTDGGVKIDPIHIAAA